MEFTAIILSADRERENSVARMANVPCKALAPINGIPMITRVATAIKESRSVQRIIICGPEKRIFEESHLLQQLISSTSSEWIEPESSPSRSAWKAMRELDDNTPVLLTTADHALLTAEMVDFFCTESLTSGFDLSVALAVTAHVERRFPGVRRTSYRLGGQRYCSCNLFGFLNAPSRQAAIFWQQVEERRKAPLKIVNSFGWSALLKYISGLLTLEHAMKRISACLGCRAGAIIMPFPEAAVDVDTPEDLQLVSGFDQLRKRQT